jgi:hypothetical protein
MPVNMALIPNTFEFREHIIANGPEPRATKTRHGAERGKTQALSCRMPIATHYGGGVKPDQPVHQALPE